MTTTQSPRFDRMNISANRCEDIVHDKFFMPKFASDDWTPISCGTAGCLVGHCVNWFHEEGIYLVRGKSEGMFEPGVVPVMNKRYGCQAIAELYQIPKELAFWIANEFCVEHEGTRLPKYTEEYKVESFDDITPRMVAKRIREVIIMLGGTVQEDYPVDIPESMMEGVG